MFCTKCGRPLHDGDKILCVLRNQGGGEKTDRKRPLHIPDTKEVVFESSFQSRSRAADQTDFR